MEVYSNTPLSLIFFDFNKFLGLLDLFPILPVRVLVFLRPNIVAILVVWITETALLRMGMTDAVFVFLLLDVGRVAVESSGDEIIIGVRYFFCQSPFEWMNHFRVQNRLIAERYEEIDLFDRLYFRLWKRVKVLFLCMGQRGRRVLDYLKSSNLWSCFRLWCCIWNGRFWPVNNHYLLFCVNHYLKLFLVALSLNQEAFILCGVLWWICDMVGQLIHTIF